MLDIDQFQTEIDKRTKKVDGILADIGAATCKADIDKAIQDLDESLRLDMELARQFPNWTKSIRPLLSENCKAYNKAAERSAGILKDGN